MEAFSLFFLVRYCLWVFQKKYFSKISGPQSHIWPLWTILDRLRQFWILWTVFDHFIPFCLFLWSLIIIWICEPLFSEKFFFLVFEGSRNYSELFLQKWPIEKRKHLLKKKVPRLICQMSYLYSFVVCTLPSYIFFISSRCTSFLWYFEIAKSWKFGFIAYWYYVQGVQKKTLTEFWGRCWQTRF